MTSLDELKKRALQNPEVKAEYERLEPEFRFASMLIEARAKAGLSQEQLAQRMGMKQTSVARIESGRHNPSMKTLQRYAEATGHKLQIRMEPQ
ncbi:helix-turn-helix domain-containing protein [Desulfovermiculus halophilus]|jgi:ribosome-binding protein aMBF1 (putative translation factor)|uniref:helix-turn-helix domain-containing protein n=1 Tax=Desulfovermiculus halophilus TaxID=339722 RepID=UPI00048427A2|nr:helix-turn-helix transcriptional regulator [Desulfovermiculus halophilus]